MISDVRIMLGCHWSRRRLQRFIDRDPAAPLPATEVARLEQHLEVCVRCQRIAQEHRTLRRMLRRWGGDSFPDTDAVARLRRLVDELAAGAS